MSNQAGEQQLPLAIDVARYDSAWPEQFRVIAFRLIELLAPWLAGPVEHIGSTSVPGLAAKPVLDMVVGVHYPRSASDANPVLTSHGYAHGQHRPETLWFHKARTKSDREQNLHLTEPEAACGANGWPSATRSAQTRCSRATTRHSRNAEQPTAQTSPPTPRASGSLSLRSSRKQESQPSNGGKREHANRPRRGNNETRDAQFSESESADPPGPTARLPC
jgi:GrpB-like predicted nucleotidyltransferase (UPF0157 family)